MTGLTLKQRASSPLSFTVSISLRTPTLSRNSVSSSPDGVEMPKLLIIPMEISRMLGRTGISKIGIMMMVKPTIGLDGLVLLAVVLLCLFHRAFPLVCWCHLGPNQYVLRLDWVAKDNSSYSYPATLYSTCVYNQSGVIELN